MKHAYLIIAHNRPDLLQNLVSMIDDERNDIFIHIDKKVDMTLFKSIVTEKSHLYFTQNRISVVWGDFSQIECELTLFSEATQKNTYDYFHLISGVDVVIKSQDEIHKFFTHYKDLEFVGFANDTASAKLLSRRSELYHFFTGHGRSSFGKILQQFRRAVCVLQRAVGFKRKHMLEMKIGPNWVSITNDACKWIVSHSTPEILREFRYTSCGDELFVQTMLWNSPFRNRIYQFVKNTDTDAGCMRFVDWKRGNPYVFQMKDFDEIVNSQYFFCRKVEDIELAKAIKNKVLNAAE